MELLIQAIDGKNSWGKNELTTLLSNTSSKYTQKVLKKSELLNSVANTKENIIIDTCNYTIIKIQSQTSWGKNVVKDIIFKKLLEEISC